MRHQILRIATVMSIAALSVSCASLNEFGAKYDLQKQSVQSMEVTSPKLRKDAAFTDVTSILVERGFDIKNSNKDAGLVSTEYKKFASYGERPPFDYYLQIRATVRDVQGGKTLVRLTPLVKEQNRLNAAAFTERELYYFEGSPDAVRLADKGGWVTSGQVAFMNVVSDVATKAGVSVGDVTRNVTTTKFNALLQ